MAILGFGDYLCEACKHFDTDGSDGNSPFCFRQGMYKSRAVPLGEKCPYGYEYGVPHGYPVSMERNERRAHEIQDKMEALDGRRTDGSAVRDGDGDAGGDGDLDAQEVGA